MTLLGHIAEAPIDPILGTTLAFNADTDPRKINLGVGAYRTEEGKPFVLDVVREAEDEILKELGTKNNKEYSTIDGPAELKVVCQKLIFGEASAAIAEGKIASVQALSGTGALRVVGEFVKKHLPQAKEIYVSDPTWGNHNAIFATAGLAVKTYPYFEPKSRGFDFDGMLATLSAAAPGSMVLLHACAHNPTGVDPTEAQWAKILEVVQEKELIPLLDSAYQGFASGDLDKDAFALRMFADKGLSFFVCQSFAKNLGLYGERIGMIHAVCSTADEAKAVLSQLKLVVRPMYSSPPIHGGLVVMKVLGSPERFARWKQDLVNMSSRIKEVRSLLRSGLEAKGTPGTWDHITSQIGMFSYTGLSPEMCERLTGEHHIYLLKSGRISMAGLNNGNMQYMVDSVDEAVRACSK